MHIISQHHSLLVKFTIGKLTHQLASCIRLKTEDSFSHLSLHSNLELFPRGELAQQLVTEVT
jgi:hypothetical protein